MGLRIAVLANLKRNAPKGPSTPADIWADLDSESTVQAICAALQEGGHEATFLEGDTTVINRLNELKPDFCFNICEGHYGDSRESQIPAVLEMLRIPYTGSKILTLALTLDKPMTKRVLNYHDLPTPPFQVFERVDEILDPDMTFPMFAKPSREGTGMGISARSIVQNEAELRQRVGELLARYRQTVLVERFIDGPEVTMGMVGNLVGPAARRIPRPYESPRIYEGLHFFPPLEVDVSEYAAEEGGIYSNRLKVDLADKLTYICPARLERAMVEELKWLAGAVFRVTGCVDVARVDFRLDAKDGNKPYILEVNPLPGLSPGISDLVIEAAAEGWSYTRLINAILETAILRYASARNQPAVRG